jgi:DNA topoisomerase III
MFLLIAEKPPAGRDIAAFIASHTSFMASLLSIPVAHITAPKKTREAIDMGGIVVSWCLGHLLELKDPESIRDDWKAWRWEALPMVPRPFEWAPKKQTKAQWAALKALLKAAQKAKGTVIHAGDPDAEGQALVDNVIAAAGFKGPVKRFWASAMTEAHLKKAFETMSPNEAFQGYRVAATARAQSDWLIGLNLTRALTLKARSRGLEGVFSVGRVQTPTLALIAEREHLHTHFVPQVFGAPWVEGEHGGVFRARLITEGGKASEDETEEDEGTQGVLPAGGVSPEKSRSDCGRHYGGPSPADRGRGQAHPQNAARPDGVFLARPSKGSPLAMEMGGQKDLDGGPVFV